MRCHKRIRSILESALALLAPAEGEEWLIYLAVGLLLLGSVRHRLEPWLEGIAAGPPPEVANVQAAIDTARFGRVDLNHAEAPELETLPRIGPALAARIIADRAARGPYHSVDDLERVVGVGPATIQALRDEACVSVGSAAGRAPGDRRQRGWVLGRSDPSPAAQPGPGPVQVSSAERNGRSGVQGASRSLRDSTQRRNGTP